MAEMARLRENLALNPRADAMEQKHMAWTENRLAEVNTDEWVLSLIPGLSSTDGHTQPASPDDAPGTLAKKATMKQEKQANVTA